MIDSTLPLFTGHDSNDDAGRGNAGNAIDAGDAGDGAETSGTHAEVRDAGAESGDIHTGPRAGPLLSSKTSDAEHATFVNTLYERHRPALLRYLLGLLRRRPDAEDVLQETYARLLAGVPLDRDEARCRAYVVRIATNLAHDRYRRRTEMSIDDRSPEHELSGTGEAPDVIVDFEQAFGIVKKTLLELKPRCRQVFLLRVSEELGYETIAERLGVSKRTVEREMQHALEVLQSRLKRSRE